MTVYSFVSFFEGSLDKKENPGKFLPKHFFFFFERFSLENTGCLG